MCLIYTKDLFISVTQKVAVSFLVVGKIVNLSLSISLDSTFQCIVVLSMFVLFFFKPKIVILNHDYIMQKTMAEH